MRQAAERGFEALSKGGSALNAVEAAIISMEDNPMFNAGKGSALNLLGEVESESGIMDGETLQGAGVALVKGIKNPIRIARIVMEKTNHVLIAGETARKLALANGVPSANLKVPSRVQAWKKGLRDLRRGRASHLSKIHKNVIEGFLANVSDTVGALALDSEANLAAGDSTGALALKLPGRIGDNAIIGAGLYADNKSGATTATGIGELAIRLVISKMACDLMNYSATPTAAIGSVRYATKRVGRGIGLITLDRNGRFGVAHNTRDLCWAARTTRSGPVEGMFGNRVQPWPGGRLLSGQISRSTQFSNDRSEHALCHGGGMGRRRRLGWGRRVGRGRRMGRRRRDRRQLR